MSMSTPRVRHVLETSIYCDDLGRTAAFYRQLLDSVPMLETERLVALDAGGGTVLLLFQRGRSTQHLETSQGVVPAHDGSGPSHFAFAIDAEELAAWETKLAALGIPIESRVTWARGGQSVYFRDPDGRSVELATPGIWPSY
jgi:catechol 2,3-dioxygenase-like lactoylglutathione lyase family enzyme